MRTLFSENIFSPSPTAAAEPKGTPLQLSFSSSLSNSSTTSTSCSPTRPSWLTQRIQNQSRDDAESSNRAHYSAASQSPRHHARRKGHPKLLFMGTRRSGKTSIQKVVFQKLPPAETLFLEPTSDLQSTLMQTFVPITSTEIPSHQLPGESSSSIDYAPIFSNVGAAIWVLDIQDEYQDSVAALLSTAIWLAEHYPRINLEVLIHKTDGLSDEYRYQTFREVSQRVQDELSDMGFGYPSVSYHQTSIFDSSIFEALSKIIQKLLPQLPAMEGLLNKLCSTCRIQKAYLFDTVSKVYVATDASPSFPRDYEVCADYVDVIVDIKQIYGWQQHPQQQQSDPKTADDDINESMVTYDRSGDTYIYAREINEHLTLICVMGKGSSADKRVLIDYNVGILHDALLQIFRI